MDILFVGHNATRTGAPLLLLELMRWLSINSDINTSLLLQRGGDLLHDFQEITPTTLIHNSHIARATAKLDFLTQLGLKTKTRKAGVNASICYVNTIACSKLIPPLASLGYRVIHHIHELETATKILGMTKAAQQNIRFTNCYIAASEAVAEFLRSQIGVPSDRIHVIHEYAICTPPNEWHLNRQFRAEIRGRLGISDRQTLVVMSGTPEHRKGTDLFVRLAAEIQRMTPSGCIHFLWLGGSSRQFLDYEILSQQLGAQAICHFQKSVAQPHRWLLAGDIFCLTSREEPFSVVMLEAALSGMPVLCFSGAGGAPELVEDDAGIVIPNQDIKAMANACLSLASNTDLRQRMGRIAQSKVHSRYLIQHQAPRILELIKRTDTS